MDSLETLVALDLAVVESQPDGWFQFAALLPNWCQRFGLVAGAKMRRGQLEELFPLLSSFLYEVDEFWLHGATGRLDSEIWVQRDATGGQCSLHASAMTSAGKRLLLLGTPGAAYDRQHLVLQRIRDRNLAYEKLEREFARVEVRSREAQKLNELKSDFLASMSHELRTPLNSILGFSDLLSQGRAGALNARQAEFVSHVKTAADHLLSLINDVLDLSKIEAGHADLNQERLVLREALNEVMAELQASAVRRGIQLEVALGYWAVFADRLRLKQIVYNLVSNALKFTPRNGRIAVTAAARGKDVCVTVADTGIGIPEKDQQAVFEKYYQAGPPTPVQQGTGLGLAIAKRLVELQGGRIWVESAPGEGSRFSFTVCASMTDDYPRDPQEEGRVNVSGQSHRIALIEDDPASRLFMEAMLTPPHILRSYESGSEALEDLPRLAPDVILLDMSLPDMSGLEVLKRLRANRALCETPVIAVSAHAMTGMKEEFLRAGVDAYFSKPLTDWAELQRTIERLLKPRITKPKMVKLKKTGR